MTVIYQKVHFSISSTFSILMMLLFYIMGGRLKDQKIKEVIGRINPEIMMIQEKKMGCRPPQSKLIKQSCPLCSSHLAMKEKMIISNKK